MTRDDVWRERLQRSQRQLKAKEDEMCRQSRYFDNFKAQLQHKVSLARDREESLQKRVYTLEKQLLDVTVSAATDVATLSAVRITARRETHWKEHERLPGARGEGEGEEERNQGRRQLNVGAQGDGAREDKERNVDNNVKLQGFIVNLQEDLKVLLEREGSGVSERRRLTEQLQEAQESRQLLCCKVEEMEEEIQQLKVSESILVKEIGELQRDLRSPTKPTPNGHHSEESPEKVLNEKDAVPVDQHQAAAGSTKLGQPAPILSAKHGSQRSSKMCSFPRLRLQSLDDWGSTRDFNVEEMPSEESDALREAYRSLGFGGDIEGLKEQYERLEATLQHSKEQLQVMAQENDQLKLLLRSQAEEKLMQKVSTTSANDGDDACQSSPVQDNITDSDLLQALNQENRALAVRIQELLAHIELNEEDIKRERSQLRAHVLCLEEDKAKLEQEKEEQGCLVTELTKKTEDDLNTILELQQKLEEDRAERSEQKNIKCGGQNPATVSGRCQENKPAECLVQSENQLPQLTSSQQVDDMTTFLKPVCQQDLQSLRVEQEELTSSVFSLRRQEEEVSLSVQTQTEEKQLLTRTVWALKEEKDGLCRALHGLKQEREHLIREVSGVKDEKACLFKSVNELKEAKKKLMECFPALEREKEKLLESLLSGKEATNHFGESVQESSQSVLTWTVETLNLTDSLKRLNELTDQPPPLWNLQQDRDRLLKSISTLKDEKVRSEHSVGCLKLEEAQTMQSLEASRGERIDQPRPTQENKTNYGVTGQENRQHVTRSFNGNTVQEQSNLVSEVKVLTEELQKSQEELSKRHKETADLHRQLSQAEATRQDAERKAAQAVDEVERLTHLMAQTEDISMENGHLTTQVKALQSKVDVLAREKATILSLKSDIEGQYNILTAQLKAKTVALDELNAEYINLKKGRDNEDDLSALVSLRTRYNDIRAKYDALLKAKSSADKDIVPLKAKLSSLLLKCQERNNLLAQTMRALREHGPVDATLTVQVNQLLTDAVLLQYTAAFTHAGFTKDPDQGLTTGFISNFQKYTCATDPGNQQHQDDFHTDQKRKETVDAMCVAAVLRQRIAISPVPTLQEDIKVPSSPDPKPKEVFSLDTTQLQPSDDEPEKTSPLDKRPASSPVSSNVSDSSRSHRSPAPPLSVSPVRRRLSSPEKILNLHEQLQQTMLSVSRASVRRGRGEESRGSLSFSAPASPSPSSQTKLQTACITAPPGGPLPFCTASSLAKPPLALTNTPVARRNQPTALFNAVTARCTNKPFTPHLLANNHFKSPSSLSANVFLRNASSSKVKSSSGGDTNVPTSPKLKSADAEPTSPLMTAIFKATDFTASDTSAPIKQNVHKDVDVSMTSKPDGAASARDSIEITTFHFPERPSKSATRSHSAPGKMRPSRPSAEAPAGVLSVEVIKQVGNSSLLIGWERPPLDELGCSHGTFVYGYRVFVDGDFYKSVMSSACTKCVLENVDLTEPVEIGVQTLGSNGLISNSVHAFYTSPGL
ncbi:trichohyalin isoform X1 [Entelurus aequoreus]|uniref:trichohyalin isoform X1 n=1 Tax=Entelurus aequoreus TaxID=161455 RepID=UPI002B1D5D7F|nr:trichohyalin isoform X1 [Entelurus aequoreus]